ncbi:phospholipase [Aliivibrio sp. 1S165]|uniref:alpha/beta hydrolase n=1 Tax=unclassified Aliivibrio TaxID=2645654 RepID=UPI00080EC57A|nr:MULTISPECIES: alpha/beta hydrolase [unclassified Aliivibrio]OCH16660.1 phospholipase [Aliivibrio sp. 1S165]OCH32887.1 phospholipase [Aliivibrio sp. 1S175]
MRKFIMYLTAICLPLLILGCSAFSNNPKPLHLSEQYYNYLQPSFDQYLVETKAWLSEHRAFISDDHEKELTMNMPFERGDKNSKKAILLVHGLGDSPYSFSDLATTFSEQGFYVQVLLLPGHGSKPEDMHLTTYQDWQNIVDHYANLLKKDYQEVWLSGFSTGANLTAIHTLNNEGIDGLVFVSPGFESLNPTLEKLSSVVSVFWDGISKKENNFARYSSISMHGMAQYSDSAVAFRKIITNKKITVPTLIVISEADSIINSQATTEFFADKFVNPNNHLIWYGDKQNLLIKKRTQAYPMKLDALHISTASHMSPLFSPSNNYYGKKAEKLICTNSLDEEQTQSCKQGENVWFSAWGYQEEGKAYARLTWNPYFDNLEYEINKLVRVN